MNDKILKGIQFSALFVSIVVTALLMLVASAGTAHLGVFIFILWAISPYICVFIFDIVLSKIAPKLKLDLILCIISVLMTLLTLYVYIGASQSKSSTAGLVFIFFPLYLHVGWVVILGIGLVWALLPKSPDDEIFKEPQ